MINIQPLFLIHNSTLSLPFQISEGKFSASINLIKQLDFETKPSYILTIQAQDSATTNPLTAFATVAINVIDVQDQPPTFLNAPYSATLQENTVEVLISQSLFEFTKANRKLIHF